MQTAWLPSSVCDQIDKANRQFLWAKKDRASGVHLVHWDKVTRCKRNGGLGIRTARNSNIAMLAKVGWKVMNDDRSIWADMWRQKYIGSKDILAEGVAKEGSYIWKGVVRSLQGVRKGFKWKIGDGDAVSFWFDWWTGDTPLVNQIAGDVLPEERDLVVGDVLDDDNCWCFDRIRTPLDDHTRMEILGVSIPRMGSATDCRIWGHGNDGILNAKAAYLFLQEDVIDNQQWNWLWKMLMPHKCKTFFWLVIQQKILTNDNRLKRHFCEFATCLRCDGEPETAIHALRDCPKARQVWANHVPNIFSHDFFLMNLSEWIRTNLEGKFCPASKSNPSWKWLFIAIIWTVWRDRNSESIEGTVSQISQTLFNIKMFESQLNLAFSSKNLNLDTPIVHTFWIPPPVDWVKLNVDASVKQNPTSCGIAGLIRDEAGKWIKGFAGKIGNCAILTAELKAIKEGLSIAWENRFPAIAIETDSEIAVNLIRSGSIDFHPDGVLVHEIRQLLHNPWNTDVMHTKREGNKAADQLAKTGNSYGSLCMIIFDEPPNDLRVILDTDISMFNIYV